MQIYKKLKFIGVFEVDLLAFSKTSFSKNKIPLKNHKIYAIINLKSK
jgi:hypothetical protein